MQDEEVHRFGTFRRKLTYVVTADISLDVLLRGQLAHMQTLGWRVDAVSGTGDRLRKVAEREGVPVRGIPIDREISLLRDIRALFQLGLHLHRQQPDVVNYGTPKAALLTSIAAWANRVPVRVYTLRGLRYEGTRGAARRILLWTEKVTSILSTDIVAISTSVAERYRSDINPHGAIYVIGAGSSNGVVSRPIPADEILRKLRSEYVNIEQSLILFVGRHHRDKGFDDLVNVMSAPGLESAVLVSVGPLESSISPMAEGLKLEGRWSHVPWSDNARDLMAAADLLCLPTRREGFGNVLVEAQGMGTPVITNDVTGARDALVANATGLLVPAGDLGALADALRRLLTDDYLREEMGRIGRKWVEEQFRPERIWSGLDAIYKGKHNGDITNR